MCAVAHLERARSARTPHAHRRQQSIKMPAQQSVHVFRPAGDVFHQATRANPRRADWTSLWTAPSLTTPIRARSSARAGSRGKGAALRRQCGASRDRAASRRSRLRDRAWRRRRRRRAPSKRSAAHRLRSLGRRDGRADDGKLWTFRGAVSAHDTTSTSTALMTLGPQDPFTCFARAAQIENRFRPRHSDVERPPVPFRVTRVKRPQNNRRPLQALEPGNRLDSQIPGPVFFKMP